MPKRKTASTAFLNVDLDIYAKEDLAPLVLAFGGKVSVLHVGREKRLFSAHLELSRYPKNADKAIRGFIRLVDGLPRPARRAWDAAVRRSFNIGIQSGKLPDCYEMEIAPGTIRDVSSVNADIGVTVYGLGMLSRKPGVGKRARRSIC